MTIDVPAAAITTLFCVVVGHIIYYFIRQGEFNQWKISVDEHAKEIKERMTAIEEKTLKLDQEFNSTRVTAKLFLGTMTEVKDQVNKIWEKLEKMDGELKDIYKNKK